VKNDSEKAAAKSDFCFVFVFSDSDMVFQEYLLFRESAICHWGTVFLGGFNCRIKNTRIHPRAAFRGGAGGFLCVRGWVT
jgi:hypothetical protein